MYAYIGNIKHVTAVYNSKQSFTRILGLKEKNMNKTVLWDVAPCNLIDIIDVSEMFTSSIIRAMMGEFLRECTAQRRRTIALIMKEIITSETSFKYTRLHDATS
jgi:hypothetical protein